MRGVRPSLDNGRDRRLDPMPDAVGRTEEERLYAVCDGSHSPWLGPAVRIAVETCLRQAELVGLTCERVRLDGPAV